jgi:radical SAM superfamily enzyme YgiQ (UPF0313 family)
MPFKRILLVKPPGRRGLSLAFDLIPIGLEYIAAYIEGAVEDIHIVDMEMEQRSFHHLIDLYRPDLVGISMSTTEHNVGLGLAKIAKSNGVATVVGEYHPTGAPDLLLSYPQVDMVVSGEGELSMTELAEMGHPEGVLGVSYKKGGRIIHNEDRTRIEDLDSLPFPARHLRQHSYKATYRSIDYDVLVASRGCYGQCSFCCEPNISGGRLRCRSPENIMEEVLEMVRYHERKPLHVHFTDPHFMGNPKRVSRLCDLLQEHDLNIEFSALVRPDSMARNPEIVKKMCKAGIIWFEMGIESPSPSDLKSTRKGMSTKVHREAVRNIRENGGSAGGTFVIGLLDQTEEEIRRVPVYAKKIGLTAAAFGIVTPFPGTEFYRELDRQGLIFESNWEKFDEMHSVYRTRHLSKEKIEELATYCMARFWGIDTFIDQARVFQKRIKKKTALIDFIRERAFNIRFMRRNGMKLHNDNFGEHIKTFLKAYPDYRVEAYTREVGIHNVLDMSRFLRILGPQTIQCTLSLDNDTNISFVFKTTRNTVEYIQVIPGKQDDSTIDFSMDLKWMRGLEDKIERVRRLIAMIMLDGNIKRFWNTFRFFVAVGTEVLMWKLTRNP